MQTEDFVREAALLKRAISYIDCNNYDKALIDL